MEIIFNKTALHFGEVSEGDVFVCCDKVFIKIYPIFSEAAEYNAVNLKTGVAVFISDIEEVKYYSNVKLTLD